MILVGGFGAATAAGPAAAAPQHTSVAAAQPAAAAGDPEGLALRQAEVTGKAVAVAAETTETDTVTANPDGTVTLDRALVPQRRLLAGTWHDLSAKLQPNLDGTLSPEVAIGDLRLSGGGTGPLATMRTGRQQLALTAPMTLPAPTVLDDTATYKNVLDGVDLEVTADTFGGFSEVLIVHDANAAKNSQLSALTFGTAMNGLAVRSDGAGNLVAADRLGGAVFTAPTPMAWDSHPSDRTTGIVHAPTAAGADNAVAGRPLTSSADGPGDGATETPLGVTVTDDSLTLTTPPSLLTGVNTVYPVYIDPTWTRASWGASKSGYASVPASYPSSNKWNNSGDKSADNLQVGNADGWKARSMVNFPIDVSRLRGAGIYSAEFDITNNYAYSCTAKTLNLYAPATKLTSSNATWNYWSGVSLGSVVDNPSFAHGYSNSCKPAGVGFDIKSAISSAVSANRTTQTFVLKTPSESNTQDYKEFSAKTAKISVTYNHTPAAPSSLKTSPATNCAANPPSIVGDGPVSLYAKVSDTDGQTLGVTFKLWKNSATGTPVASSDPNKLTAASGTTPVLVVPRNTLYKAAAGVPTKFVWQVTAYDGFATSTPSSTCTFTYDPTRTGPPDVTPPDSTTVGRPATFTIAPPATGTVPTSYMYQLNGGTPATAAADSLGNATVTVTPTRLTNTLAVTSRAVSGNIGDAGSVMFNAAPAGIAAADDFTGDGAADLVTAGGNGTSAGLWLAPGTGTGINPGARNIGVYGTGVSTTGSAADFTGGQAISGHFTGTGLQDVLVYYPSGHNAGLGVILNGNGDGSPLQAQFSGDEHSILPGTLDDGTSEPLQLANAGALVDGNDGVHPDLIGIAGDATGYYLQLYPNSGGTIGYGETAPLIGELTPTGGVDWNTWTIATAQDAAGHTDMYLWQASTGALYLWADLAYDDALNLTYDSYALGTAWNVGQTLTLAPADVNRDGVADLRTVGVGAAVTTYLVGGLATGAPAITAQPAQTLVTTNHTYVLNDGDTSTGDIPVTAAGDTSSTLNLTASGSTTWHGGDMYDPDVDLDGVTGMLAASGPAVTTNADFSVSVWAKPTANGGTVLSQDGTNIAGFRVWADPGDKSWRFAMSRTDAAVPVWDTAAGAAAGVVPGAWTLITATYRQSGGAMTLYVNGTAVAHAAHSTPYSAAKAFRIGAQKTGASSYGGFFDGQVALAQTWNKEFPG